MAIKEIVQRFHLMKGSRTYPICFEVYNKNISYSRVFVLFTDNLATVECQGESLELGSIAQHTWDEK